MTSLRAVAALSFLFVAMNAMAALPELRLTSVVVKEDERAEIRVFVTTPEDKPARFRVTTADGTAVAGEDYVPLVNKRIETTSGTTIRISIVDDNRVEPVETFYLDVTDVENAVAVTTRVSITIQDDGAYPDPTFGATMSVREGENYENRVEVVLTMSEALSIPFTVRVFSTSITAQPRVDYKTVDDTVTFIPGRRSVSIPIIIYGDDRHEADETFRLEVEGLSSTAIFTIIDDDEPNSLPGVSINEADVIEGTFTNPLMRFRVALTAPSLDGVTVRYETESRGAIEGADFRGQSGLLQFKPGEQVKWIDVEVLADDQPEWYWEFFDVLLVEADGANLEREFASGRIRDDDAGEVRWLKVHDAVAIEGTNAVFRLELTRPSDAPIEVRWAVAESTHDSFPPGPFARAPRDFLQKISAITFRPGEVLKEIAVPITSDSESEGDEYFGLFIAPAAGVEYDPRPGMGIIIDDDREWDWPLLRVEDRIVVEGDNWTLVHLPLTLSRAMEIPASVVVATREPGELDFEESNVTVTFAPGETHKVVVLRVRGDDVAEPLKIFNVDFREPSGMTIARDSVAITVIDDDRPTRDRAVRH